MILMFAKKICIFVFIPILISGLFINDGLIAGIKEIENGNQVISYPYDALNCVDQDFSSAALYVERFSPIITKKNDNELFVEYENTFFGTVNIVFPKPLKKDTKVKICLSEKSVNDTTWNRTKMNSELIGFGITYYETDVTIEKGTKEYRLILPDRPLPVKEYIMYDWKGGVVPFCCCSITCDDDIKISEVQQLAVHILFNDDASRFESDDELLNEIYEFCKQTIKATTYAGVYVDGYRELRPYEADALINELGHFSVDSNYDIAKETIRFLIKHHTWPTEWILQTVSLAYEYYMYSGDIDFLKEIYPELKKCLLEDLLDDNGLLNTEKCDEKVLSDLGVVALRDIIDWPQNERDGFASRTTSQFSKDKLLVIAKDFLMSKIAERMNCFYTSTLYKMNAESEIQSWSELPSPNSVVNAFYYDSLRKISFLASEIGYQKESNNYSKKAEAFKKLYQDKFVSLKTKLINDTPDDDHSSLHSNMFALKFGLVPDEDVETVCNYIISKGMSCSVYGSQYLLECLFENGYENEAFSLITSKEDNSWYKMIYGTGSKLTTEAWNEDIKNDMDWNHAWGTAPVNIITRYIVGVKPGESGCEKMIVAPHPGDLKTFNALVPINNGEISVDFTNDNGNVTMLIKSTAPFKFDFPNNAKSGTLLIDDASVSLDSLDLMQGEYKISYSIK